MSLFCGAVALRGGVSKPESWIRTFRNEISRRGFGQTFEYLDDRIYVLKLDLFAFEGSGWHQGPEGTLAAIAGDPILRTSGGLKTSNRDIAQFSNEGLSDLNSILRQARGNFSFLQYRPADGGVIVGTDRLGLRPIYWTCQGDFLVFAGAIRLLLSNPDLTLEPDIRGLLESVAFGFPLQNRTEYVGIKTLESGEVLDVNGESFSIRKYWSWSTDAPESTGDSAGLRKQLYDEFIKSVELRGRQGENAYAALSGGLDTRCVVAALLEVGRPVKAVNVSWRGSLDQILGRKMAHEFGIPILEKQLDIDETGAEVFIHSAELVENENDNLDSADHSWARQLWGGNDGSISVGYVYVTRTAVERLRENDAKAAADHFIALRSANLSEHVFQKEYREAALRQPAESLFEILNSIERNDPGQRIYIFLLQEYQRRLLHKQLQDIDLIPIERIEPFLDTSFLSLACQLAVDESIGHRFYLKWLKEFPPVTYSVPWQSYPGHEPCWLEVPDVDAQWLYFSKFVRKANQRRILDDFDRLPHQGQIGSNLIDWRRLKLLRLGQQLGISRWNHVFRQATAVHNLLLPIS